MSWVCVEMWVGVFSVCEKWGCEDVRVCYVEMMGRLRGVRWWWRLYLVVDGVSSGGRKVAGNARGEVGDEDVTNDESTLKKSY